MPVIVRNMSNEEAVAELVQSNIQRENVLPSERAWAYKMYLEAAKRQGARTDLTSPQIAAKFRSDDEIGKTLGISGDTLRRVASLTVLVPAMLDMVDNKQIGVSAAYELTALKADEQDMSSRSASRRSFSSGARMFRNDTAPYFAPILK